ncbi:MAG: MFS transporter, partial [Patulibacter sp.]|nr:MFS transporter [Patulibacter sp.]
IGTGQAQWLLTATLLVAAVSVPVAGRLADMFGRRLVLLISLAALAVGSALSALTSTFELMLVGRAIAGLSAAAIPLGISLLATILPPERRAGGTALISAMLGVGGALGLPLAGLIGDSADYHVLYWIGGGGALLSFLAIIWLVEEPETSAEHHIDLPGIGLLVTGLVALILAISQGGDWGWGSPEVLALLVGAVAVLGALVVVERRRPNPLLDVKALSNPPIALTNLASVFVGFALFASFTGTANYVQAPEATGYGFGSSTLTAGLCLLPSGLLMLVLSPVAASLMKRLGPARVLGIAGTILAAGLLFRVVATGALWEVVLGTSIIGVGSGVAYAALPALINAHTPRGELAAANGFNALSRSFGSTLASAVGGALFTGITLEVAGTAMPSLDAYRVLFGICAAAAIVASAIGFHIAGRRTWVLLEEDEVVLGAH